MDDPSPTPGTVDSTSRWISAINDATIYSGPGNEYTAVGTLEAGSAVRIIAEFQNDWIPIECPAAEFDSCWVVWDYNALFPYEGSSPIVLTIPDPASLKIDSIETTTNAWENGRWQTEITRSESVYLSEDTAWFFYVELKVISLEDDTVWTPVSEWHAAGLGEEGPPRIFHWSRDGRYLYFTSTHDYHGVNCALYDNIGASFNRLDLSDGTVVSLSSPRTRGILTLSPDEQWIAYLSGEGLIVRELAKAFDDDPANQNSVKWQIPLDDVGPAPVSGISWSGDNAQVLVVVTDLADDCQLISRSAWALDMTSGEFGLAKVLQPSDLPTPTGLWHFNEGEGTLAADESGFNNHGILNPLVKWGTAMRS